MKAAQINTINKWKILLFSSLALLCFESTWCQPTVLYSSVNASPRVDLTDYGLFRQGRLQCNQSGTQYWAFNLGTSGSANYSSNWRPYDPGNILSYNNYIPIGYTSGARYNGGGGSDGELSNAQHGYYYTFNVSENTGDNIMHLLQTSYNPVVISTVTQYPASCKGPTDSVTITITTASAPASGGDINTRENIFVRYSTDGYVTSSVVQATFSANVGTAVIPAIASGTVSYYAYSTNEDLAGINSDISDYGQTGHDMATLNLNNNSGANYSYDIAATTTWTSPGAWTNGVPTSSHLAIIDYPYDTASNPDINVCSLTLNNSVLTIRDTKFVTIQNNLTINTGATLEIENQGSLVMVNDLGIVTNNGTGIANVHKTTTPFEQYDYTYWATPINSSSIATTFPTWRTDYAFEFVPANFNDDFDVRTGLAGTDGFDDEGNDWSLATTMIPGKGYIIMGPTSGSFPRTEAIVFSGKVNNGEIKPTIALTSGAAIDDDWNLVGNPYPSAISANAFINTNLSKISGTLYFWTHKADISGLNFGPDALNFSQDDYAMYNLTGGIGTGSASNSASAVPTGYIASGQGFFVEAETNGFVTFNNAMRANTNPNTQFFKASSKEEKTTTKDRIWLNLENAIGMFSQQLLGYFYNTTLGHDNGYDGLLSDGGNYINFYSFIDESAYKIQARPTFVDDDQVQLGYFSAIAGTFNINIDNKEGVFNKKPTQIYLEDQLLNIIHDLKKTPYSFTTEKGTFNNRFVLRYVNKFRKKEMAVIEENEVHISNKNHQIKIDSPIDNIDKVFFYDLTGKEIYQKTKVNSNELTLQNLVASDKVLVVKIVLQNGQTVTKKVVY